MHRRNVIFYLILFVSNALLAQHKVPKVTFGIERGIEKSNNNVFIIDDIGNSILRNANIHNYWRFYAGIPFRFTKFEMDAGIGFSSNKFNRNLVINNGGFPGHDYGGLGIDYFLKFPLGIGEDRFEMGPEFRHQIFMSRSRGGPGSFSSQLGTDGTVKNSYISLGAYAHYIIIRQDQVDLGLNATLGFSAFKYHNTFFHANNLSLYMNLGIVFYMYNTSKQ